MTVHFRVRICYIIFLVIIFGFAFHPEAFSSSDCIQLVPPKIEYKQWVHSEQSLYGNDISRYHSVANNERYAGVNNQRSESTIVAKTTISIRDDFDEDMDSAEREEYIADPLEPINRIFFHFNDRLYFWFLKPVASGYEKVVPQPVRVGVRNFFSNLLMPVRAVNCLLQGKFERFANEIGRFVVNTSVGCLGFMDIATSELKMEIQEEDFGQTIGRYGFGPGFFINFPILGPSSFRDALGTVGDMFLDPLDELIDEDKYNLAVRGYERVNNTSLSLGEYESLKKAAIDPYIAMRDFYYQYRKNKIKE